MSCPFCQSDNASSALVCTACGRDIVVPESLVRERDALLRKRDILREALATATSELETWGRLKKRPSS